MLISLPYLRAGLCHHTFSTSFRISSPFYHFHPLNIMTLSIVLFLRALFFVALVTSLAAGNPIPTTEENSFEGFKPINEEKEFLLGAEGWTRLPPPEGVSRFFVIF